MEVKKYHLTVNVAGVNLLFSSEMEVDICQLRDLFKHHLVDPGTSHNEYHLIKIETVSHDVVPKDARLVWQGMYHGVGHSNNHDNRVMKYLATDGTKEYFVADTHECIINDLTTGTTTCSLFSRLDSSLNKHIRTNVGSIIILLTHIVLAYHNRYSLHASAVEWRDRAIVFMGKSGQGKSTISTDLASRGVGFLGDDIVFIYLNNGVPYIAPLFFDAKLFENSKQEKSFVDILERYNLKKTGDMPLQAFVNIKQTREGGTTIQKEGDSDTLFEAVLQATNTIAMQYDCNDWLTLCATLINSYCIYTCNFGDRAMLNPNVLDSVFE